MTPERIAEIRKLLDAATPRPWYYNSYSDVQAASLVQAWEEAGDEADYPLDPRPGGTPGHPFFDDADNAWLARRNRAYELDFSVADVPALYGDTAQGRHRADAELIAQAPDIIEELLAEIEARTEPS